MKKLLIFIIFSIFIPSNIFAIGQMTEPIIIDNALRGQEVIETLTLLNSKDKEESFVLSASGDIDGWATFYQSDDLDFSDPIESVTIPARSYFSVLVKINIPIDTPNKNYAGELVVKSISKNEDGEEGVSSNVGFGVGREVSITITDNEIIDLKTAIIPLEYSFEKDNNLEIKIIHTNNGNISIKPSVQIKITKNNETAFNAIFPYAENEEPIKPGERKEMPLFEWQDANKEAGKYRAEIKILVNGEVVQEEDFGFSVVDPKLESINNFADKFLAGVAVVGWGSMTLGWIFIGLFFVIISIVFGFVYFLKKHRITK